MHHLRKKKAMGLIEGQTDPMEITKLLLQNEFTEQEVSEIIASLATPPGEKGDDGGATTAGIAVGGGSTKDMAPIKSEPAQSVVQPELAVTKQGKPSNYQEYDLWQIAISRVERTNPTNRQKFYAIDSFTCVKKLKTNVKLEKQVVDALNAQSHNNERRYYPVGKVTNGDTEKVDLTTII